MPFWTLFWLIVPPIVFLGTAVYLYRRSAPTDAAVADAGVRENATEPAPKERP